MKHYPWWPPLPDSLRPWRWVLFTLLVVLFLGWLVIVGLFVAAIWQGEDGIAQAGAAAASMLLLVFLGLGFPWLFLLVALAYGVRAARKSLSQWLLPWRRRAIVVKYESRRWSGRIARPVISAYGGWAWVRSLATLPRRLWRALTVEEEG